MAKETKHRLSRRDFIKGVTALISGTISALMGVPVIGYLLAPALREEEAGDVINLGSLENYPIGVPTPFSITQTRINGWERTAKGIAFVTKGPPPRPLDEFDTKIEDGNLYVLNPPFRRSN